MSKADRITQTKNLCWILVRKLSCQKNNDVIDIFLPIIWPFCPVEKQYTTVAATFEENWKRGTRNDLYWLLCRGFQQLNWTLFNWKLVNSQNWKYAIAAHFWIFPDRHFSPLLTGLNSLHIGIGQNLALIPHFWIMNFGRVLITKSSSNIFNNETHRVPCVKHAENNWVQILTDID